MRRGIAFIIIFSLFQIAVGVDNVPQGKAFLWPLKSDGNISSTFGDARSGRFHLGVDLRTGGREGMAVYAPEDGYVWRIKTSYMGYGKGLYIKGQSGRIYVFGHLQSYNGEIGKYLRQKQIQDKRYYEDISPSPGKLSVKAGQLIARSGQSGAGAPHLHFEVRDNLDRPTNPFLYDVLDAGDKSSPRFRAIWITYLDKESLFSDGNREVKLTPVRNQSNGQYTVGDTIMVWGSFGIKVAIDDFLNGGSFRLAPFEVSLYIDEKLYHQVKYDRIGFDDNRFIVLDRDFDQKKEVYEPVINLYRQPGNRFSNYTADAIGNGSFPAIEADVVSGYHSVLIEASDPFGNSSSVEFTFYYMANDKILMPFKEAIITDSTITLPFYDSKVRAPFDSAFLYSSGSGVGWKSTPVRFDTRGNSLVINGDFRYSRDYRLEFKLGSIIYPPYYFSAGGISPALNTLKDEVSYEIAKSGIRLTVNTSSTAINWLVAQIVTDKGTDSLYYRKTGRHQFSLYYSPAVEVNQIKRIITSGPSLFTADTLDLMLNQVRAGEGTRLLLDSDLVLSLGNNDLFDRILLKTKDTMVSTSQLVSFTRGPFVIIPQNISFAGLPDLQIKLEDITNPEKIGLYVFEDKEWNWVGGKYNPQAQTLSVPISGAGVMAVIADTVGPVISSLNVENGGSFKSGNPPIRFAVYDKLSGIENDLNFNVTIDGKWIIPEYDPERKVFVSVPHWRLTQGSHVLKIEVHDRCGNRTILTRTFHISSKTGL